MAGTPHTDNGTRYLEPSCFTRRVFNPAIVFLTRAGLSVRGSRELRVRGRKSGEWRKVPVNLLELDGHRYLVAPRGHTQWVRNLRAAGTGELRVGRRVEHFGATEVPANDATKVAILREYLRRWSWEVGVFFEGVGADATDAQLLAVSERHPAFEIATLPAIAA